MEFDGSKIHLYRRLEKAVIEDFCYGEEALWRSSREPLMSFKHIFRRLVSKYLIPVVSVHAELEGVVPHAIYRSRKLEPKLEPPILQKMFTDYVMDIINEHPHIYLTTQITAEVSDSSVDVVAKKYGVHRTLIDGVLDGREIPAKTFNYLFRQCTAENKDSYFSNI